MNLPTLPRAIELVTARLRLRTWHDSDRFVSFTTVRNRRSRAIMKRIGMRNATQDFEHPGIPEGHEQDRIASAA